MATASGTHDHALVEAIRAGDTGAFERMIAEHGEALLRAARFHTDDIPLAEDALQDTWLAVLHGIERFEERASLGTWLSRIFVRRLLTRIEGERRQQTIAARAAAELADDSPSLPAGRFLPPDHPKWPGHWKNAPRSWGDDPEQQLLSRETRALVHRAIADLPPAQRQVIALRDVGGWSAAEVCQLLELSESNQRVLLHRARSKVRSALEEHFNTGANG